MNNKDRVMVELKVSDIKIATKCAPEDRKRLRGEILKDIQESENE